MMAAAPLTAAITSHDFGVTKCVRGSKLMDVNTKHGVVAAAVGGKLVLVGASPSSSMPEVIVDNVPGIVEIRWGLYDHAEYVAVRTKEAVALWRYVHDRRQLQSIPLTVSAPPIALGWRPKCGGGPALGVFSKLGADVFDITEQAELTSSIPCPIKSNCVTAAWGEAPLSLLFHGAKELHLLIWPTNDMLTSPKSLRCLCIDSLGGTATQGWRGSLRQVMAVLPGVFVATSDQPLNLAADDTAVLSPADSLGLLSSTRSLNMAIGTMRKVSPSPLPDSADAAAPELVRAASTDGSEVDLRGLVRHQPAKSGVLAQLESITHAPAAGGPSPTALLHVFQVQEGRFAAAGTIELPEVLRVPDVLEANAGWVAVGSHGSSTLVLAHVAAVGDTYKTDLQACTSVSDGKVKAYSVDVTHNRLYTLSGAPTEDAASQAVFAGLSPEVQLTLSQLQLPTPTHEEMLSIGAAAGSAMDLVIPSVPAPAPAPAAAVASVEPAVARRRGPSMPAGLSGADMDFLGAVERKSSADVLPAAPSSLRSATSERGLLSAGSGMVYPSMSSMSHAESMRSQAPSPSLATRSPEPGPMLGGAGGGGLFRTPGAEQLFRGAQTMRSQAAALLAQAQQLLAAADQLEGQALELERGRRV